MGKVEKVIVLSVLFLIALILVVSLTVEDPLNKSKVVEAGAPATKPTPPVVATAPVQTPVGGLLSTSVQTPAPVANGTIVAPNTAKGGVAPTPGALQPVTPPALPAGALLKSVDGLEDSILTDMKLYTWKEGDTYRGIANKYYGNWEKFTVLRRSNEGRMDVKPGDKIFVPIFDTEVAPAQPIVTMVGAPGSASTLTVAKNAADASAAKVAAKKGDAGKKDTAKKADAGKKDSAKKAAEPKTTDAKVAAASSGKKTHLVKEGESLWKIAKDELGNGGRWKEIFELNKDVLSSPEAVHKGQSLRIP